jgi:hypothetical protein
MLAYGLWRVADDVGGIFDRSAGNQDLRSSGVPEPVRVSVRYAAGREHSLQCAVHRFDVP